MKTLYLPLKKEWYEMIESGVKTEEYREVKPYWIKRLCDNWVEKDRFVDCMNNCCINCIQTKLYNLYKYDAVKFSYGYTKRTMTFEIESITIGKGKPEWGAPTEDVFIIKLGGKVTDENNKQPRPRLTSAHCSCVHCHEGGDNKGAGLAEEGEDNNTKV